MNRGAPSWERRDEDDLMVALTGFELMKRWHEVTQDSTLRCTLLLRSQERTSCQFEVFMAAGLEKIANRRCPDGRLLSSRGIRNALCSKTWIVSKHMSLLSPDLSKYLEIPPSHSCTGL